MITIKQLSKTSIKTIHEAFSKAFSDYVEPFDLTQEQLQYMIERRGCDFNLSFGAFDNDELVGFTLNGVGVWNGKLTAYDTGTGIIKEYRKKGIATRMFDESLPVLRLHGVEQYLLEVIRSNKSAVELYKKAGFKTTREFDYYISKKDKLSLKKKFNPNDFTIREITNPDWLYLKSFWSFEPSWQNSIDSINRKFDHFRFLGIYKNEDLLGYGIVEKTTGDIPQLAIADKSRRLGLGSFLLNSLIDLSESKMIKIINVETSYKPFKAFAAGINLLPGAGQYEMLLKL